MPGRRADTHRNLAGMELPQELVELVIDSAQDDRHTLATCGLVCTAWLPRSRRHLFRRIQLLPSDVDAFLQLFEPQSSAGTICCYTAQFDLDNQHWTEMALWQKIFSHCRRFNAVKILHLKLIRWDHLNILTMRSIFPNLSHLDLHFIAVDSVSDLLELLLALPALENLSLSNMYINKLRTSAPFDALYDPHDQPFEGMLSRLRFLRLHPNLSGLELIPLFLSEVSSRGGTPKHTPNLQHLDLEISSWSHLETVAAFFRSCGDVLLTLKLSLNWFQDEMGWDKAPSMSRYDDLLWDLSLHSCSTLSFSPMDRHVCLKKVALPAP